MDELFDLKSAAARLAVSVAFLRKRISRGTLPAVKVGNCVRLRASDLAALVQTRPVGGRRDDRSGLRSVRRDRAR